MPVLKCTMCGGDLDINSEMTVGVCQFCGSTLTIPKHIDKLGNLYNRANALRQNNEFDKAIIAYEDILKEDFNDADAHWGLLLCKYGIEYVEDPNTGDRVPTCHRLQYDSILMDSDYQAAINNADLSAKVVFEAEARRIDRIQKRILEISSKEDPFDVFICYKETDDTGNRSEDSVIAQEMYYELTKRGFKVFYARKTLEGKLGNAYEPVIFAALNSAKAMVVLGTKADNFTSVWVKNEWSRYRELIKKGQEKTLIPAYRGFSAYGLPIEFSNLQALDMSKLGFMHDLMDGLEKIVGRLKNPQVANSSKVSPALVQNNSNIQPLLDRAYLCLEDGEFSKADELLEQVLNLEPRSASAYVAKLMVELKINQEKELGSIRSPLTEYNNYQKAIRFADEKHKMTLEGYNQDILDRLENERKEKNYQDALTQKNRCRSEQEFKSVAGHFRSISGYKDADALASECDQKAEQARIEQEQKDEIARQARLRAEEEARIIAEEDRVFEEKRRFESERQKQIVAVKLKKQIRLASFISAVLVLALAGAIFINNYVIEPSLKYKKAQELLANKQYEEAIEAFTKLDGFKDSVKQIENATFQKVDSKYNEAQKLLAEKRYSEAVSIFEQLGNYRDSNDQLAKYKIQILENAIVGNLVYWGQYEQDNNTTNGKEDIAWKVLDVVDGKALLISEKNLDCQPYHNKNESVTWATSTLREWLNTTFISEAFTSEDKYRIVETVLINNNNIKYEGRVHDRTNDNIFLLSILEADQYFTDNEARIGANTPYAVSIGAFNHDNNGWWWLRSPGDFGTSAAYVVHDGSVRKSGGKASSIDNAVRPAMWINLKS